MVPHIPLLGLLFNTSVIKTWAYILKVDFLDVRNPQKIQIFRRKIVSERENYQFCNVLEKILLIDTLSLCSIELNKHSY